MDGTSTPAGRTAVSERLPIPHGDVSYYAGKEETLRSVFGAPALAVRPDRIVLGDRVFPVIDDVIVCLAPARWPGSLRRRLTPDSPPGEGADFAADIQYTFGQEWQAFPEVRPDHEPAFRSYFDLVDLTQLANARVCDLGCGMGRWSYFASRYCREIVLVDFSEAIFVARRNLRDQANAIFIMADIKQLPLANDFADLLFCLGVLHHLPTPALDEVVALRRYAPRLLVYLYYALDNRPWYFRVLLRAVTGVRHLLTRLRNERVRKSLSFLIALAVYQPLIWIGTAFAQFGSGSSIPLYDAYRGQSFRAIAQDAYDRFFTRIEQRVSRREIETLSHRFRRVVVSERLPYWHFLCER